MRAARLATAGTLMLLAACTAKTSPSPDSVTGINPRLPPGGADLLPAVHVFKPTGWGGGAPTAPADLKVASFAAGLNHPRWLYRLPNGDILVAESNGKPEPIKRPKDWVMRWLLNRAGAGVPSPDRIVLLRDSDGDGVAETRSVFLDHLNSPFGMALVGHDLYVADTDALLRVPYADGETRIAAQPIRVTDLPGGPIDHHWTKNVVASPDGTKLFVSVGSNSNVAENGMAVETGRAAIWQVDPATGAHRILASGLRNPNGMDFEPATGVLWTVGNERDELGDNLVPDYLTSVKDGGFYGWPYSYYGQHVDARVRPQRPDLVARAIPPDYALGPHVAPLGLVFYRGGALPSHYLGGAFVGEHGSWNRATPNGYRVVFVPFQGGRPAGKPQSVLDGFLAPGGARGRPVGVTVDKSGALLVADDVGNTVWRVTAR